MVSDVVHLYFEGNVDREALVEFCEFFYHGNSLFPKRLAYSQLRLLCLGITLTTTSFAQMELGVIVHGALLLQAEWIHRHYNAAAICDGFFDSSLYRVRQQPRAAGHQRTRPVGGRAFAEPLLGRHEC